MKKIIMLIILFIQIILIPLKIENLIEIEWLLALINCLINVVVEDD